MIKIRGVPRLFRVSPDHLFINTADPLVFQNLGRVGVQSSTPGLVAVEADRKLDLGNPQPLFTDVRIKEHHVKTSSVHGCLKLLPVCIYMNCQFVILLQYFKKPLNIFFVWVSNGN